MTGGYGDIFGSHSYTPGAQDEMAVFLKTGLLRGALARISSHYLPPQYAPADYRVLAGRLVSGDLAGRHDERWARQAFARLMTTWVDSPVAAERIVEAVRSIWTFEPIHLAGAGEKLRRAIVSRCGPTCWPNEKGDIRYPATEEFFTMVLDQLQYALGFSWAAKVFEGAKTVHGNVDIPFGLWGLMVHTLIDRLVDEGRGDSISEFFEATRHSMDPVLALSDKMADMVYRHMVVEVPSYAHDEMPIEDPSTEEVNISDVVPFPRAENISDSELPFGDEDRPVIQLDTRRDAILPPIPPPSLTPRYLPPRRGGEGRGLGVALLTAGAFALFAWRR